MSCDCDTDDISLVKGTAYTLTINYKTGGLTPVDLTGVTVTLALAWGDYVSLTAAPIVADGLVKTSSSFGSDGVISFTWTAGETATFPVSCAAQKGPVIGYQVIAGSDLVLEGSVDVERNIAAELA